MLKQFALVIGVAFLLAGCAAKNLYVAHDTVVGVNGSLNSNNGSGHLMVGYDRNFVGMVPRVSGDSGEAMAVRSCSKLVVKGIKLTEFSESLATGAAATEGTRFLCDENGGGSE